MLLTFDDDKQKKRIEELYKKEEEDLARILSKKYGIPYIDLTVQTIDTNGLRLIPEDEARDAKLAIFDLVGRKIRIAVLSPSREKTQSVVKMLEGHGYLIERYLVSTQSLERAWSRYKDISYATESKAGSLDIANKEIEGLTKDIKSIEDVRKMISDVIKMKKSFKISRIVEVIAAGAISIGASDIHIEPEEFDTRVRFRLDGVLVDVTRLDIDTFKLLLSRIKLLSGMKLNVKNVSQDGRFTIHLTDSEIEIRSSILPGSYFETIVMRILDPESIGVPLENLGIRESLLEIFLKEIDKPNGMILNTGPTGSGKTTTLYAFLKKKKSPEVKIITIEDPIEYHLPGIVQTQVDNKKGYNFASGLKSSLRQDPDVIMVGEIRDLETAETAVHAALTGHLVFSTLHTNNAVGAFARLIDLGINPKILTSAINLVIAQRLVRRLCPECRKQVTLSPEKISVLKKVYDSIKTAPVPWSETFYEPQGCPECNGLGYKGRIGIYEAVTTNKEVEEVLQRNPSEREIKNAAMSQGIMDMAQDGVIKIIQGITTLAEVERVVDIRTGEGFQENIKIAEVVVPDFKKDEIILEKEPPKTMNPPIGEKSDSETDKTEIDLAEEKEKISDQIRDEVIPIKDSKEEPDDFSSKKIVEESTAKESPVKKVMEKNNVASTDKKHHVSRPDIVIKKTITRIPKPKLTIVDDAWLEIEKNKKAEALEKIQEEERVKRERDRRKNQEELFNLRREQKEREAQEKILAKEKKAEEKKLENNRLKSQKRIEDEESSISFIEDGADKLSPVKTMRTESPSPIKDPKEDMPYFIEEEPDNFSSKKIVEESTAKENTAQKDETLSKFIIDDEDEELIRKSWNTFDEDEEDTLAF